MNRIQVFENQDFGQLRTVMVDGEPWFVAADVCRALELGNTAQALTRLDVDEKGVILNDTPGGKQEMSTVNEPGFYSLVLGSRKPEAKAFKRWVTHEVLPALRKTGRYTMPNAEPELPDKYMAHMEKLTALLLANNLATIRAALQIQCQGRRCTAPQEPDMGNLYSKNYKVVAAGYAEQVMELLRRGWTGKAIQEYLREQGVEISEMSVWRFAKRYKGTKAG